MIRNERQYRITKAEAGKFQRALDGWDPTPPEGVDPAIHAAQKSALESQFRDLKRDVAEYEALRELLAASRTEDPYEPPVVFMSWYRRVSGLL